MKNTILLFILIMSSCNVATQQSAQMDINKMKIVVWQLMQVDEYYAKVSLLDSTWKLNRKNVEMYQQVFDLNKIERSTFYKTMNYLERHPVEFKRLMDSVNEVSKREKNTQRLR
jgi:hypothetical protein